MELRARYTTTELTLRTNDPTHSGKELAHLSPEIDGDRLRIKLENGLEAARLATELDGVLDVEIRHGSMDDVFLAVTAERKRS